MARIGTAFSRWLEGKHKEILQRMALEVFVRSDGIPGMEAAFA
jgi:hypothetical protein